MAPLPSPSPLPSRASPPGRQQEGGPSEPALPATFHQQDVSDPQHHHASGDDDVNLSWEDYNPQSDDDEDFARQGDNDFSRQDDGDFSHQDEDFSRQNHDDDFSRQDSGDFSRQDEDFSRQNHDDDFSRQDDDYVYRVDEEYTYQDSDDDVLDGSQDGAEHQEDEDGLRKDEPAVGSGQGGLDEDDDEVATTGLPATLRVSVGVVLVACVWLPATLM